MILMDLQLNNLRGFRNFHLNTACPKETDNAAAPDAHLSGCPDFRYRKLVLVSGANGTGKTGIGRMLRDIFNFVSHQDAACLMSDITDTGRPAVCQMDFVPSGHACRSVRIPDQRGPAGNSASEDRALRRRAGDNRRVRTDAEEVLHKQQ